MSGSGLSSASLEQQVLKDPLAARGPEQEQGGREIGRFPSAKGRRGGESCPRPFQSAPLFYKSISPSLHSYVSFLVVFWFFGWFFVLVWLFGFWGFFFVFSNHARYYFLRQLKPRNETQGNTHCIPGMIRLCSLHSTPEQRWEAAGCQHHQHSHQGRKIPGQSRILQPQRFQ